MRRVIKHMDTHSVKKFNLVKRESLFDKKIREYSKICGTKACLSHVSAIAGLALLALVIFPNVFGDNKSVAASNSAQQCAMYGVQDAGGSDSQLFKLDIDTNMASSLGGEYENYDIEGIDFHPHTGKLYAISGNGGDKDGNVYVVDDETGDLSYIGNSGATTNEIVSASFNPDGTLWGFQENVGLVTIDLSTGASNVEWLVSGKYIDDNWEGLAWDNEGSYLYGVDGSKLFKYDPSSNSATRICTGLPSSIEALEFRYDGALVAAQHGSNNIFEIDPDTCDITPTGYDVDQYDDIESLTFSCEEVTDPCDGNNAPTASFTPNETVFDIGETVTFDASSSSDPDNDTLEYEWKINGTVVSDNESFTVSADKEGEFTVTLTVKDGCASSTIEKVFDVVDDGVCKLTLTKDDNTDWAIPGEPIYYTINVKNTGSDDCTGGGVELVETYDSRTDFVNSSPAPSSGDNKWNLGTIVPGENKTIEVEVLVDASVPLGDPDIHNEVCVWAAEFGPKDDSNNWQCVTEDTPIPLPPDQCADNNAPTANAGDDQTVTVGSTVTLDGSSSNDSDNDQLTYSWEIPSLGLSFDSATADVTFTDSGTYEALLTVSDGCASDTDSVTIIVKSGGSNPCANNNNPIASIDPVDPIIEFGETVSLNASSSTDSDNDTLTYEWKVDGTVVSSDEIFEFAPSESGTYEITLTVFDGCGSDTITTTVTVNPRTNSCQGNTPPIAEAGDNISIKQGEYITLDGSASSDADGDTLTYNWLIDDVGYTFSGPVVNTQFNQSGVYTVSLTVNDGCAEDVDYLTIVSEPEIPGGCQVNCNVCEADTSPTVIAGPDITVNVNEEFTLDGSSSYDTDSNSLNYKWSIDEIEFTSNEVKTKTSISKPGVYTAILSVGDACSENTDELTITVIGGGVNPCALNTEPVAFAGQDIVINEGEPIVLDASNSFDPDNNNLTYQWEIPNIGFSSNDVKSSLIIDKVGVYPVKLTVRDQCSTDSDELNIRVTKVLGETFTPPKTTPRAGAGIPTMNFVYGLLSGLLVVGTGIFRAKRETRRSSRTTTNFIK